MTRSTPAPDRQDILLDFATAEGDRTALLATFTERFPEHAEALRSLAGELGLLEQTPPLEDLPLESHQGCSLAQLAAFRSALGEAEPASPARDVFAGQGSNELRALAKTLDVNGVFLSKVKDRLITFGTMPAAFVDRLGEALSEPLAAVRGALASPPRRAAAMQFKADGKPGEGVQQSFEEAIETSGLSEAQKSKLREL